jgi:hypothetical protein
LVVIDQKSPIDAGTARIVFTISPVCAMVTPQSVSTGRNVSRIAGGPSFLLHIERDCGAVSPSAFHISILSISPASASGAEALFLIVIELT